jgi:MoxR-like ATPase
VLGQVLACDYRRIQFTPDLMPSDVIGGNVFNQQRGAFDFLKGPVFTQLLLADEINRAPAKTQSALLEAMQERQVTVDGVTRPLPEPFLVMATQNPIESQGTYPLPEAQLDRFMFKLSVLSPSHEVETAILRNHLAGFDAQALDRLNLARVITPAGLLDMQNHARRLRVDEGIVAYIADIVCRTRAHRSLYYGASPRASIALLHGAQARAASRGRDFVIPDDVKALAPSVIRHRVGLQPDAEIEGMSTDDCVAEILRDVRVPETIAA